MTAQFHRGTSNVGSDPHPTFEVEFGSGRPMLPKWTKIERMAYDELFPAA